MSFLFPLALAVAVLVGAPLAAHFLRRGQAREVTFPAASLVPTARATAKQRARLEDRGLLALRSALVVALALLGASPLMRCSRLSVARPGGASLALAVVLDDSLSMQAAGPDGQQRWQRALEGAQQLLANAREGDAFSVVLAGAPARLALAATTELSAVRASLESLTPSSRATDLDAAVRLAESTLADLPHVHKRTVVFSDLATPQPPGELLGEALLPLDELRAPFENCGIVAARVRARAVEVEVVCTEGARVAERRVELRARPGSAALAAGGERATSDAVFASQELRPGEVHTTVRLAAERLYREMDVRITGKDALAADDVAPVVPPGHDLVLGVLVDPATASVQTGGATVLETALRALDTGARIEPLTSMPDEALDLERFGALIVDDPPGLTPEVRAALQKWLEQGGVALAFLGPGLRSAPLGATFDPFLGGAPVWEDRAPAGIDPQSAGWLGDPAHSLLELGASGRARLSQEGNVLARWEDGEPWLVERRHGRGIALSAGLPVSVDQSDLALRPGFLALLDHLVQQARARRGGRETVVGHAWELPPGVLVEGPGGPVPLQHEPGGDRTFVEPPLHGRYNVRQGDLTEERFATLHAEELVQQPQGAPQGGPQDVQQAAYTDVDVSRELAVLVLALAVAELLARAWLRRARGPRLPPSAGSGGERSGAEPARAEPQQA
jgi:hypothetical protein